MQLAMDGRDCMTKSPTGLNSDFMLRGSSMPGVMMGGEDTHGECTSRSDEAPPVELELSVLKSS